MILDPTSEPRYLFHDRDVPFAVPLRNALFMAEPSLTVKHECDDRVGCLCRGCVTFVHTRLQVLETAASTGYGARRRRSGYRDVF
jgi:hypothetical protein